MYMKGIGTDSLFLPNYSAAVKASRKLNYTSLHNYLYSFLQIVTKNEIPDSIEAIDPKFSDYKAYLFGAIAEINNLIQKLRPESFELMRRDFNCVERLYLRQYFV